MRLNTKRKFCSCGGTIALVGRSSLVTIYTENGALEAEHLEARCRKCRKGYFFGYSSDSVDQEDGSSKKQYRHYDEDCLEAEVCLDISSIAYKSLS